MAFSRETVCIPVQEKSTQNLESKGIVVKATAIERYQPTDRLCHSGCRQEIVLTMENVRTKSTRLRGFSY